MKKYIYLILLILIFGINFNKMRIINVNYNYKLDSNTLSCPGSATCCESGYNIMCHMVDPIKQYRVTDTVCNNRSGVYHKGIDLGANGDGSIYAVFDGVVVATTNNDKNCVPSFGTLTCSPITCKSSRGISVTIEVTDFKFAGYKINYLHMSSKTVSVGDVVRQGDKIGVIGNTGCSTGKHLHFQINNLNGDAVVVNDYFTNKSAYTCGGFDSSNYEYEDLFDGRIVLRNDKGYKYNASVGNCIGNVNGSFFEGVELKTYSNVAYVHSLSSGVVLNGTTNNCVNGVSILSVDGKIYTYCNLQNKSKYVVGDYVEQDALLGTINSNSNLIFSVKKYTNYVDISSNMLLTYGGTCENYRNRKNCNRISDFVENYACKQVFK